MEYRKTDTLAFLVNLVLLISKKVMQCEYFRVIMTFLHIIPHPLLPKQTHPLVYEHSVLLVETNLLKKEYNQNGNISKPMNISLFYYISKTLTCQHKVKKYFTV